MTMNINDHLIRYFILTICNTILFLLINLFLKNINYDYSLSIIIFIIIQSYISIVYIDDKNIQNPSDIENTTELTFHGKEFLLVDSLEKLQQENQYFFSNDTLYFYIKYNHEPFINGDIINFFSMPDSSEEDTYVVLEPSKKLENNIVSVKVKKITL